ncbi:MAG: SGNH/GDSL hydrolase family protein [Pseudomonadota bacterium]
MYNPFSLRAPSPSGPALDILPVIPSDTEDLSSVAVRLYVESGGTVVLTTVADQTRTVQVGDFATLPVGTKRVHATGTTASGIHALTIVPGPVPTSGPSAVVTPPTPASNQAIILGDSRIAVERSRNDPAWAGGTEASKYGRGIDNWLEALSHRRVICPSTMNFAIPGHDMGEQLATMAGDLTTAVAAGAGFIIFLCGVNGIRGGDDAATVLSEADACLSTMKDTGLPIIVINDWPSLSADGSGDDFTTSQAAWDVHRALHAFWDTLDDPQVTVVDGWSIMGDASATSPVQPSPAKQLFFEDSYLHQQTRGSHALASALMPTIDGWFPTVAAMPSDNPLSLQPLGTTGGSTSGYTSGTIPSGWTSAASNMSGVSVVGSATTMQVGGVTVDAQQVVCSGTAPAGGGSSFLRAIEQGFAVSEGETYRIMADFEVDAGATGVESVDLAALAGFGGSGGTYDLAWFNANDNYPETAVAGRYETLPFTIPVGITSLRLRWRVVFRNGASVACTARIGNIRILQD